MSDLHAAIEDALEEAAEDTGMAPDEIFYDIAMSIMLLWEDQAECEAFCRAHGWGQKPWQV